MTEKTMRLFVTAIVERALKDWRKAVALLADNPDYPYALETKLEIEEFFADEWFEFLCEISPELTAIDLQEMSA